MPHTTRDLVCDVAAAASSARIASVCCSYLIALFYFSLAFSYSLSLSLLPHRTVTFLSLSLYFFPSQCQPPPSLPSRHRLQTVGSWWWSPSEGSRHFLREPIYRDLMDVYSDFGGRVMKSSVVDNWPFFRVTKDKASGEVVSDAGIDFHLLNTIAEKLNFTSVDFRIDGKRQTER